MLSLATHPPLQNNQRACWLAMVTSASVGCQVASAMPTSKARLPFKSRITGPERRARIEEEAARLFAQRGYEATTLEAVAGAADVSRAVVYDHFASKRQLHAH